MLLRTAERLLIESVLHTGTTSGSDTNYRTAKLHQGIIGACNAFLRAVRCSTTTTDISIGSGDSSADITDTVSAFEVSDFVRATINNNRVGLVPANTVQRRHAGTLASGRPSMVGFVDRKTALFDKEADQAYTLKLTRIQIADFMPGSRGDFSATVNYGRDDCVNSSGTAYRSLVDSNIGNTPASSTEEWEALDSDAQTVVNPAEYELPLPVAWANDVIHWGARAYALMGLDGHPDAGPAMQHFTQNIIPSAVAYFARNTQAVDDAQIAAIHRGVTVGSE